MQNQVLFGVKRNQKAPNGVLLKIAVQPIKNNSKPTKKHYVLKDFCSKHVESDMLNILGCICS